MEFTRSYESTRTHDAPKSGSSLYTRGAPLPNTIGEIQIHGGITRRPEGPHNQRQSLQQRGTPRHRGTRPPTSTAEEVFRQNPAFIQDPRQNVILSESSGPASNFRTLRLSVYGGRPIPNLIYVNNHPIEAHMYNRTWRPTKPERSSRIPACEWQPTTFPDYLPAGSCYEWELLGYRSNICRTPWNCDTDLPERK